MNRIILKNLEPEHSGDTSLTVIRVRHIKLDTEKRIVYSGVKSIHLTKKEFNILKYLMLHTNRIVAREEISTEVWGEDSKPLMSNILDVHIKNLRKKLSYRKLPIIETVRGVGYRIRDRLSAPFH